MSDLFALLFGLIAYGGGAIALTILIWGLFAARRRSSVIACAVIAALLFAGQVGFFWVLYSFGAGFSGGDPRTAGLIKGAGFVAALLVAGFLALKLPRVWGGPAAAPREPRDGARIAAAILAAYALYLLGIVLLHHLSALLLLSVWLMPLVALILAWGLWRHHRFAWYASLGFVAYELAQIVWRAPPRLSDLPFLLMSTSVGVSLLLLIAALGVLLLSNARKLCAPSIS